MNSAVYGRSINDRKSQCHLYLRQSSLTPPRNGSTRAAASDAAGGAARGVMFMPAIL